MSTISPHAIISPDAQIGSNVEISHFCIIESGVTIGNNCQFDSHVVIKPGVTIGNNNQFGSGSVIGGLPQHVSAPPPFGNVRIGEGNVFREDTTVHRAIKELSSTVIGNENYLMAGAHVAHDCMIGDNNTLGNGVMLGGHVIVGNRAILGGGVGVHQHCRIGTLAMVGGQATVLQDVPPFFTVDGLTSRIVGLNSVGLQRNGQTSEEIKTLKKAYFTLYRSSLTWKEILLDLQENYSSELVAELTQFLLTSTNRGIVRERTFIRDNSVPQPDGWSA